MFTYRLVPEYHPLVKEFNAGQLPIKILPQNMCIYHHLRSMGNFNLKFLKIRWSRQVGRKRLTKLCMNAIVTRPSQAVMVFDLGVKHTLDIFGIRWRLATDGCI